MEASSSRTPIEAHLSIRVIEPLRSGTTSLQHRPQIPNKIHADPFEQTCTGRHVLDLMDYNVMLRQYWANNLGSHANNQYCNFE